MFENRPGATLKWTELAWRSTARNRTFMLPDVVSFRLDQLVEAVEAAGGRASRTEIVGALLAATPPDPAALEQLVRDYKRAQVADVHLGRRDGPALKLEAPRPGPRARA